MWRRWVVWEIMMVLHMWVVLQSWIATLCVLHVPYNLVVHFISRWRWLTERWVVGRRTEARLSVAIDLLRMNVSERHSHFLP